jgi:hypothetical protein
MTQRELFPAMLTLFSLLKRSMTRMVTLFALFNVGIPGKKESGKAALLTTPMTGLQN